MKKFIIATILTFILAIMGFITVFLAVDSDNDTVTVTEKVLHGDTSAAKGITVVSNSDFESRLLWQTTCEVGNADKAETVYNYYSKEQIVNVNRRNSNFNIDIDIRYGYNHSKPYEELEPMEKAFTDIYNACPINGSLSKRIYLKDLYDFYPIRLQIDIEDVYWSGNDYENLFSDEKGGEKYVTDKFREYFKIPVLEDYAIDIKVSRSGNGASIGTSEVNEAMGYDYFMNTNSAVTEDTVFFTIRNKTYRGIPVDTSLIPGGYGIYSFKYSKGTYDSKSNIRYFTDSGIDADSLDTVYALDPEANVESLSVSKNGKDLILVETKGENSIFTVIDIETMTKKHEIVVEDFTASSQIPNVYNMVYYASGRGYYENVGVLREGEDFYILLSSDGFALIDKNYEFQFVGTKMNYVNELFSYMDDAAQMVYDGERLIVVDSLTSDVYSARYCSYYVAVYEKEGLTYYGEYNLSLDANKDRHDYGYNCHPYGLAYTIKLG